MSRQRLLEIRVAAFRRRVLSTPAWRAFAVWGAGRDAKAFANALDGATRRRIVTMLDVDRNKCGRSYANHRWREEAVDGGQPIPVAHFEDHAASESARRARGLRFPRDACGGVRREAAQGFRRGGRPGAERAHAGAHGGRDAVVLHVKQ